MEEKKGTAATKAKNKWNAKNYDRLYVHVKKGKKEKYKLAAEKAGFNSLNSFIVQTMDNLVIELLEKD